MTDSSKREDQVRLSLRRGLAAARASDYGEAGRWFQAALDTDPENITALLWLAWLTPSRQESLTLLSRVLELDPHNERARAGIRWARRRLPSMDYAPGGLEGEPPAPEAGLPERADLLRESLHSPEVQEKARSGIAAQRARRLIGPLGLLLAIALCLLLTGIALIAWYSPSAVLAWMLPSPTPTVAPAANLALDPTVSPDATASPTPIETPTPSPTPTTLLTDTVTPTFSPSPTATLTVPAPPPPTATPVAPASPTPGSPLPAGGEKWIEVDLTQQRLIAYQGNTPVFQAMVSTGLPRTPTVVGQFRINLKLKATTMAGPGYYLPDVPYTMYFHASYALHGTYWHNNFGQPMSHGCVNLRTEDAEWLFNWADPPLPTGTSQVRTGPSNPGTLVVVHY